MAKKQRKDNALAELLAVTSPEILKDLIQLLANQRADVRRECWYG